MGSKRRIKNIQNIFRLPHKHGREIDPDQILLDSSNLIKADTEQMEGHLIAPLERSSYITFLSILFILGIAIFFRLFNLQVVHGNQFSDRSANNSLQKTIIFANRGTIYDRDNRLLAFNDPPINKTGDDSWGRREYATSTGLSVLLGYVGYPKVDSKGNFYDTALSGKDGLEAYFDDALSGKDGVLIKEIDATGKVVSQSAIENPVDGTNITLSIDERVQNQMYEQIKQLAEQRGYQGGAGIIMDIHTGEILAMTSYPEYSSQIMSDGTDSTAISAFLTDPNNPFLDRPVQGLYIPGSIIKPYIAVGALEEHTVDPLKKFLANGFISVPNPYDPAHPTIYKDWKILGWLDMRGALAMSSDVYFYTIGGGYGGQRGLGIDNIHKYVTMFGFGSKTGIEADSEPIGNVPSPAWKAETFPSDPVWRLGDTYISSIGQYGFLVTPIQVARAVSAIANGGHLVPPTIIKDGPANDQLESDLEEKGESLHNRKTVTLPIAQENLQIIREGMREGVLIGTGDAMNIPDVKVAAKTGTAELGITKEKVNSWSTGFWPYDNPRYAFVMVLEKGSRNNTIGSTYAMRGLLQWMAIHTPEYLKAE